MAINIPNNKKKTAKYLEDMRDNGAGGVAAGNKQSTKSTAKTANNGAQSAGQQKKTAEKNTTKQSKTASAAKTTAGGYLTAKISEQEFNRSPAMQKKWGSYSNYFKGRKTTSGGFYSQTSFNADAEALGKDIAEKERTLNTEKSRTNTVIGKREGIAAGINEKMQLIKQLQRYASTSPVAVSYIEKLTGEYNKLIKEYDSAQNDITGAIDKYNAAYDDYAAAVGKYENYTLNWYGTVRDKDSVQKEMASYDTQIGEKEQKTRALKTALQKFSPLYAAESGMTYTGRSAQEQMIKAELRREERELEELKEGRALLEEELALSQEKEYAALKDREDFEETSKYVSTANGKETSVSTDLFTIYGNKGFDDPMYDYINKNEDAIERFSANDAAMLKDALGIDMSHLLEMSDEEVAIYNYLWNKDEQAGDKTHKSANDYIKFLTPQLTARQRAKTQEEWAERAREDPVGTSILSIIESPLKTISYIGQAVDYLSDGKIDQNAGYNKFSYINSAIRDEVSSIAEQKWGGFGSFAYQTGMSMGDFLFNSFITGGFGSAGRLGEGALETARRLSLGIMGAGAAADTVIEAKDRGLSDWQAFSLGTIAGAAEIFTEKFSIEALLEGKWEDGAIKYIVKNAFTEGTEEVASDFINLFADILISKDKSQWAMTIDAYKKSGKSEQDAFINAVRDQALSMGLDFLGGAFSGGIMASFGAAIQHGNYNKIGGDIRALGDDGIDAVFEAANKLSKDSEVYKQAQELKAKRNAGQPLSDAEIGRLFAGIHQEASKQKNAASAKEATESTTVNDDPAQHTQAEQAVIEEYKNSVDDKLKGFIERVRTLKDNNFRNSIRTSIDTKTDNAINKARELTGVDTTGYTNIIKGNTVQHIDNRHGINGEADRSMRNIDDFSRIGFVLDNFTDARVIQLSEIDKETARISREWNNSDNTHAEIVQFSMPVNGTYYVVEAVPSSKAKVMAVVSAYMSENGSKNQKISQSRASLPENQTSSVTSKTTLEMLKSSDNGIVPQNGENINAGNGTQAPNANYLGNTPNASLASSLPTNNIISQNGEDINGNNGANSLPGDAEKSVPRMYAQNVRNDTDNSVPQPQMSVNGITAPTAEQGATVLPRAQEQTTGETQTSYADESADGLRAEPKTAAQTQTELTGRQNGVSENTIERATRIARAIGKEIIFYSSTEQGENGHYDNANGVIYINAMSENPIAQIIAHEMTHAIENNAGYDDLQRLIFDRIARSGADIEEVRRHKRAVYERAGHGLSGDNNIEVDREITAEYIERNLLTDEDAIYTTVNQNRSLGQRILQFINDLLGKLGIKSAQDRAFLMRARGYYQNALQQTREGTANDAGAGTDTNTYAETNVHTKQNMREESTQSTQGTQERTARETERYAEHAQIQRETTDAIRELREAYRNGEITETEFDEAFDILYNAEEDLQNGIQYSISEIAGEKEDYGKGVILDTEIFKGVNPRNWGRVLGDFVYNNLAGEELTIYDENGNAETVQFARENDRVRKDGAKNSRKVIDKLARYKGDNIRAVATIHLSELLETSRYENTTDEHSHQWMDENGWTYRKTYLQDRDGNIYEATLNIAEGRDRHILYDISNIRKIDTKNEAIDGVVPSTENGRGSLINNSFDNSIPSEYGYVNEGNISDARRPTLPTAGDDGIQYSISRTTNNIPFVDVEEDILDGVPKEDWVTAVKENMKEKFPSGIAVGNNEINIDGQSRREMTYSRYMQWLYNNNPKLMADKLRATNNADEIIQASTNWINEGLNHPRADRITDFARGSVLLRIGGNDYTADVVVGMRRNGSMVMYDVLNLQQTSFTEKEGNAATSTNPSPGAARNTALTSDNSIPNRNGNVNNENISDARRLTLPTAGDDGIQYSISEIAGEKEDYGKGVILDTEIFKGVNPRNWGRVLGDFVYNNLAGEELTIYDENGNAETVQFARENDRVRKDGAKNSRKVIDKLARYRGDSIRAQAIVQLSELLETSRYENTTDEHSHQWMDENGWTIRKAYLQDRYGNIYEATLNIAEGKDRRILYEVNRVHKIDEIKNLGKNTDTEDIRHSRYQETGSGGSQSEAETVDGAYTSHNPYGKGSLINNSFDNSIPNRNGNVNNENISDARRLTLPTAGDDGIQYSITGKTADGTEVYETSDEVRAMPYKKRMKTFMDIMRNEYRGRTAKFTADGNVYYAKFYDADLRKNIYGDKKSSQRGWRAKINVGADGDIFELVENASYDYGRAERGKTTAAHRNVNGWEYFVKTVQIDGTVYDLLANVRKKPDGEFVYYIQLNENTEKAPAPPLAPAYTDANATDGYAENRVPTDADNSIPSEYGYVNEGNISDARRLTLPTAGDDGIQYSISRTRNMDWEDQVNGYFSNNGTIRSSDALYLGESDVQNIQSSPLYIPTSVINKAIRTPKGSRSAHSLQTADIMRLKSGIDNAPIVIHNPTRNALIYVTENRDGAGNHIIATFDLNHDLYGENAHKATSIYGRENITALLEGLDANATIFAENENKLNQMLPGNRILRSPELLAKVELVNESISNTNANVNEGNISDARRLTPPTAADTENADSQYSIGERYGEDRREIISNIRGILNRGGSAAELRRYVNMLSQNGRANTQTDMSAAQEIVRNAHEAGLSVNEYLSQNWDMYEYDGEPNDDAKRALELERRQSRQRYSISETDDGRAVAVVDDDILSGIDTGNWDTDKEAQAKKAAKTALFAFKDGIQVNGITYKVNRTSRREYTRSNDTKRLYLNDTETFADKMRAAKNTDDIITAATLWKRDGELRHTRNDNFADFEHGNVLIQSGEKQYDARVIVGITKAGEYVLYDVADMRPTSFNMKERPLSTAPDISALGDIQGGLSDNSISNGDGNVNKERTDTWLSENRLQLPLQITEYGPIGRISYIERDGNGNFTAKSDNEKTPTWKRQLENYDQYSINETFERDIDDWERDGRPNGETFILGSTGDVLQGLGAMEQDIYLQSDKINAILRDHSEMTPSEIKRIPEILDDPVLILKSNGTGKHRANSRMVLFGSVNADNGQPVMSVLDLRPFENGFLLNDMQKVNSAYTKNNPINFLKKSEVMYADGKRTIPLLRKFGLTTASRQLLRNGSMGSIFYKGTEVNIEGVPFSSVTDIDGDSVDLSENARYNGENIEGRRLTDETAERIYDSERKAKRASAEFQRTFSGEVKADEFTDITPRETAAIRSALKTGYGQIDADGRGGRVNTARGCYIFNITPQAGAEIKRFISHNELNIHNDNYTGGEQYDAGGNSENVKDTYRTRSGQRDGNIDYTYGSRAYGDGEDVSVAGRERDSDSGRNLQQGTRDNGGDNEQYSISESDDEIAALLYDSERKAKRASAEFQRAFSGEVKADEFTYLAPRETAAIRSALKTGYGQINADGRGGTVNTARGCYSFEVTQTKGVVITDVFDHNELNIHSNNYTGGERYDTGGNSENVQNAYRAGSGQADGNIDYTNGPRYGIDGEDVSVAGGEPDGNGFGSLRRGVRDTRRYESKALTMDEETSGGDDFSMAGGEHKKVDAGADDGKRYSISESDDEIAALPKKAQSYLKRAENDLVKRIGDAMSVPRHAQREFLQELARDISKEYLREGTVSQKTIDNLFERAYNEGIETDSDFYDNYKDIKDYMRRRAVTVSENIRGDIADWNDFRKSAAGTLRLVNEGGAGADTVYEELRAMAPELFPSDIVNPTDMLMHMFEVGRSIRSTEKTLSEYYGDEAQEFKRWAKNDFNAAINDAMSELRNVKRYAQEREAKAAERAQQANGDIREMYAGLKNARRTYEKAAAKNLLTDHDRVQVGRLLRGEIEIQHLDEATDNIKGIKAIYEARQEYEKLSRQIKRHNEQRKTELRAEADEYLKTVGEWKDKTSGLKYARETMERNIRDIVKDRKTAERIIEKYFKPVHDSEADANRAKNKYRGRIRALEISQDIKNGNKVSEAYAVQFLGEAEDNIRVMEQSHGAVTERDGKTLTQWRDEVLNLWLENPNLDEGKIRRAINEFRNIYDELFEQMNEVRVRNGYEPINYRRGYFPHFQSGTGDGVTAQFGRAMGIDTSTATMPTAINDLTANFKTGIQWFGNAKSRQGTDTQYNALEGFDRYIEGAAGVIYQTDNIQRLRALASQIRYRTSGEGIRKQADTILENAAINEADKQLRLEKLYETGRPTLNNFVEELDEYTNLLANKRSRYDRFVEHMLGGRIYNAAKWFESRVAVNMVAVNPASWLTNFIPLTQGAATLDRGMLLKGMWDTLKAYKTDDGIADMSTFLTNRRGSDPIVKSWKQSTAGKLSSPMEYIDLFTADSLVRARYAQNLKKGLSEDAAMNEADAWTASIMADRSKGSMPTLFERKNPIAKAMTQFQLEVNNQLSYLFKDMPKDARDKGLKALTAALLKFFFGAYLFNEVYEFFIGRRPALDPIGILNETAGDITGYELPNLTELGTGMITGDMPSFKTERKDAKEAIGRLGKNISEEIPFVGNYMGGGRLPVENAIPDLGKVINAATNSEQSGRKRLKTAGKELGKLAAYFFAPFGGGQMKKIYEGIDVILNGGSYTVDSEGNDILQYPLYNDTPLQTGFNAARMMLFGKTSLPTAQDWIDRDFKNFGAKETASYQAMTAAGVSRREAYELVSELKAAEKTQDESRTAVQADVLRASSVSAAGKAAAYYGMIATDKERALLDELDDAGADPNNAINTLMDIKDAESRSDKMSAIARANIGDNEVRLFAGYVMGTELVSESGSATQYGKLMQAMDKGIDGRRGAQLLALGADLEKYLKITDAGANADTAYKTVKAISELEPAGGSDKISDAQRWRAVIDATDDTGEQIRALRAIMSESTHRKLEIAYDFGVEPSMYVALREIMPRYDANGNGSYSNAEITAAINAMSGYSRLPGGGSGNLTTGQKAVLWQVMTSSRSAKNNPYSSAVGRRVLNAKNGKTQSYTSGIKLPTA